MTITKAVPFVMAIFLLFSPPLLAAQAPTSDASKPDDAALQAPFAAEANDSAEIAQKLTNPLAAMISVPLQNWFDFNLGSRKDGFRYTMEAQPVYPTQISKNWNLLSRTTLRWYGDVSATPAEGLRSGVHRHSCLSRETRVAFMRGFPKVMRSFSMDGTFVARQ
jgi:hypothetical protein